ncbi:MAG: GNAT family N-acetyltransferase [Ruminiclostridium sp.]|nr:GNAT family N-acetyltransferase [Ruminiclostridium sp.]MBQ9933461.1 GNAT family N-acetyltransferase [Ruminiclostridium sp.]
MHGTIILHTHRLTLRQHVLQDAPVLHRFFGLDEAMYQYSGWNPYATEEMAMETMGRFLASYPDSRFYGWAIEHLGELVGTLGAYDYDPNRRTIEVGLSIFRPHWGQGFATEALARILDYLTGPEGIRQVIAWCTPDNTGSRRVMEKCGMVPTQGQTPDRLYFRHQAPTYEIERKFLIAYPDVSILEAWPDMTRWEMVQTYLLSQPEDEVRVRQRTQDGISRWFHTVKRGEGIKRQEEEREITREEYQALLTQADPTKRVLHKTRYCLPYRGKLLEVDLYPFWQDQAVLEVELEQEDDLISIPPQLTVLREVTGDAAYKNAVLAKSPDKTDKEVLP